MRIFQNEESIVEYVASGEAKGKKNSIVQNYGLEMIIREYVNECWERRVLSSDLPIQEKASRVQCPLNHSPGPQDRAFT